MLAKPEAILFDMGGVLLESADTFTADAFPLSFPEGLPEPAPLDWFLDMSQDCLSRFVAMTPPRPAMDCRPLIADWLRRRDVEPTADTVERWRYVMEQWEARPIYAHVRPTLATLCDMGYRMGVISNTFCAGEYLRRHFEAAGILEFLEFAVFSAEFGMNKPHPSIFRHALDAMGLQSRRAWYVGDKPQRDVCGAHGVGMTAVLVDSAHADRAGDAPENEPDLRIADIAALPKVLRGLEA
ncbi:MAG: HAD-IA family hydrolase [Candidatus Hydrogenedentes bacterium]|nr:HAD-IA family hydrolase [Candidatus Hydrogenedentota bacterium]